MGARLNLREFGEHPGLILLGLILGAAAITVRPGESSAIILGALVTIGTATLASSRIAARQGDSAKRRV